MTTPAASSTNRWGSRVYPIPKPGTNQVIELTSVSKMLDLLAKPALERWRQDVIAEQFALRHDLVMLSANPETRKDAIKTALASTGQNANIGTAVHGFSEMVDAGTLDWNFVPEPAKPWVSQYAQGKEDYGWGLVRKEFTVYNHELGYAGTSDRFLTMRGFEGTYCGDLKTGSGVYPDHGLQMGFYVYGEGIWVPPLDVPGTTKAREVLNDNIERGINVPPNRRGWSQAAIKAAEAEIEEAHWREYAELGEHVVMPEDLVRDLCFVIHVSATKCEVVPLNIKGIYETVAGLGAVGRFQSRPRKDVVLEPLQSGRTPTSAPPVETAVPDQASGGDESVEAVLATPQEQPLEPATEMPVAPPVPREQRISVFVDRIGALSQEAKQKLVFNWPAGIPTFKQSHDQTDEQLEMLDKVLWAVESEFPPSSEEESAAVDRLTNAFNGSEVAIDL